jgi:hypothetical protein
MSHFLNSVPFRTSFSFVKGEAYLLMRCAGRPIAELHESFWASKHCLNGAAAPFAKLQATLFLAVLSDACQFRT